MRRLPVLSHQLRLPETLPRFHVCSEAPGGRETVGAETAGSVPTKGGDVSLDYRQDLPWFTHEMAKVLGKPTNEHKGSYRYLTQRRLLLRIKGEVAELEKALEAGAKGKRVIAECCDVANFAMMLAANERRTP